MFKRSEITRWDPDSLDGLLIKFLGTCVKREEDGCTCEGYWYRNVFYLSKTIVSSDMEG